MLQHATAELEQMGVEVLDLGPGNQGNLGPAPEIMPFIPQLVGRIATDEYRRLPSGLWTCTDGRGVRDEQFGDGRVAPARLPGGLVGTNTSGDMMDKYCSEPLLSERVAYNTYIETKDDPEYRKRILMHGDDHGAHQEEDGCLDNRVKRSVLAFGAEHASAVAPVALELGRRLGVTEFEVDDDSVLELLAVGGERAAFSPIWDLNPRGVVQRALNNGAEYVTLTGSHREFMPVATMDESTFDSRQFAQDNRDTAGEEIQAFSLSLGSYAATTFRDSLRREATPDQAAQKVMRGLTHVATFFKAGGNEDVSILMFGNDNTVDLRRLTP